MTNCLICGVGGQGTILASRILAMSAMLAGYSARTSETIGMAQRGGCVTSHIRYDRVVYSPMISVGQADLIIGLEPAEAVRNLPFLKENGLVIASTVVIRPVSGASQYEAGDMLQYLASRAALITVDGQAVALACATRQTLNIALIGAAIQANALGISEQIIRETLTGRFPQRLLDINLKALALGMALARRASGKART